MVPEKWNESKSFNLPDFLKWANELRDSLVDNWLEPGTGTKLQRIVGVGVSVNVDPSSLAAVPASHPFRTAFNTENPNAVTFTLERFIVADLENPSVILPVKDADESYLTGNNHYIWIEREYDAAGDPVDDIIIKSVAEGSVDPTFASGQWEIELDVTEDDVPVTYQKFWRYLVAKVEIVISDNTATVTVTQLARNNLRIFDRFYNFFPAIYPLPI